MKRYVLIFCMLTALSLSMACNAHAWCIYNKTDGTILITQWDGAKDTMFHKRPKGFISPGGKHCCNWQTEDCNTGGKRTSTVSFDVQYEKGRFGNEDHMICSGFKIKAGGWITASGKGKDAKCEAHF